MEALGAVWEEDRLPTSWGCLLPAALEVPFLVWLCGTFWVAPVVLALNLAVVLLGRRISYEVRERGIVVRGFLRTRQVRWEDVERVTRMPLSFGQPGGTGAIVVDGKPREVLALRGARLDEAIARLNRYRRNAMREQCAARARDWRAAALALGPRTPARPFPPTEALLNAGDVLVHE